MDNTKKTYKQFLCLIMICIMSISMTLATTTTEVSAAAKKPSKVVLTSVKSADYDAVKLTWKKANYAKNYQVYRATSQNGKYKLVKTTTAKSFTNKGLTTGKKYYYKVRAVNGKKKGEFSYKKYATPKLQKAAGVKVNLEGYNTICITWKKVNGADGYQIYRSNSKNGTYKKIKSVKTTDFNDTGLDEEKTYYYKVRAYKNVNKNTKYGEYSNIISCKTGYSDEFRIEMLEQINEKRAEAGVEPLKLYSPISVLAQEKAVDLYDTGVFSHHSKNLGYFNDQYDNAGIEYEGGGENIAAGASSVSEVMNMWMNSPGHKENILDEDYTHVGVGYYKGYWVQQFAINPGYGYKLIEEKYFDCPMCGKEMSTAGSKAWEDETSVVYDCPNCEELIWKCLQCKSGYYKHIGIEKEENWIAGRCNNCGLDQYEEYIECCQNCNTSIFDNNFKENYYQDNYVISFRYPNEKKSIMQEFSASTFACKNCNQYMLASCGDFYSMYYTKLKDLLKDGQNIYDYIIWKEEIGSEDIENGEPNENGWTPVSKIIYGPEFSWPMESLDEICGLQYKYND